MNGGTQLALLSGMSQTSNKEWMEKKNAAKKSPEIKAQCKYSRESMRQHHHRKGKTGRMI